MVGWIDKKQMNGWKNENNKWMGGRKDTRIDKKILMVGGWWLVDRKKGWLGGQKRQMDGWMYCKKQMDGWKEGYKINGWLDGYKLIYEILYEWLDGYKNQINGRIERKKYLWLVVGGQKKGMAGWIKKIDGWQNGQKKCLKNIYGWLDGQDKNRRMVGWIEKWMVEWI